MVEKYKGALIRAVYVYASRFAIHFTQHQLKSFFSFSTKHSVVGIHMLVIHFIYR